MELISLALILGFVLTGNFANAEGGSVDFAREVAPLLKRACWECHGEKKQEGGLRLDQRESALRGGDSGPAILPGKVDQSELIARISLPKNSDGVMPAIGEPLTLEERTILKKWIESGAEWTDAANSPHWAYESPTPPSLPKVASRSWARTAIDHFILARLEREAIPPSPAANPAVLLRRLYFDLTGLPPTPDEVDAFLADESPNAYERVVDRLLASPQFGVRWARPWLDYARYADSHGFQRDDLRDTWAYRDWVVAALNGDMPFDQFSIEQIAGDLIPNASQSQKVASGFNRNVPTNVEAGSDPEETRVNQVFDRVNTLGMIWLGTTLECCQCHDHKYDPFTLHDYYGLFAFFNSTEIEAQRANPKVPGSIRFLGPQLPIADPQVDTERNRLKAESDEITERIAAMEQKAGSADPMWEAEILKLKNLLPKEHLLAIDEFDSLGGATHQILDDHSVLLSGEAPDQDTYTITVRTKLSDVRAIKLEALTDSSLPGGGPGRGDERRPNFVLNTFSLTIAEPSGASRPVNFVRATADYSQKRFDVAGAIDDDPATAWAINPRFFEPHWAIFELSEPFSNSEGGTLTFRLVQNFGASRTIGRLRLSAISGSISTETVPQDVLTALETPVEKRSAKDVTAIAAFRLKDDKQYQRLKQQVARVSAELSKLQPPTSLVMRELDTPRSTNMLLRGDFRNPGEVVEPATPAILHPFSSPTSRPNRLDLARWLVSRDNPLVSRVVVNRWWAEIFGQGLVPTVEDFGIKGEPPTHPELLDWLAVEYMQGQWSLKDLLREIVTSAAYRQSSGITPELMALDDQNRLYARGPRSRLEAEAIRDNALMIAGLLSFNQGGAPIRPYQPDGIWVKVGGQRYDYEVSPGEMKYRRGLYVVLKRSAPYPSFVNFDANNRMACRVRRAKSNTPLQALTLLNDPVYVDAAKSFACRVLVECPTESLDERLQFAFRTAVARSAKPAEIKTLRELYAAQLAASQQDAESSNTLVTGLKLPGQIPPAEFAAWYAVATALLNLDETITKG